MKEELYSMLNGIITTIDENLDKIDLSSAGDGFWFDELTGRIAWHEVLVDKLNVSDKNEMIELRNAILLIVQEVDAKIK